jgi:2-C-methyl-D-erythritol 4-phosphate cytidylyltransferase
MNTAIIVAAGTGSRLNSEIPKQFIEVAGKPVIVHTLERFDACPAVDEIVLVLGADAAESFTEELRNYGVRKPIRIAIGGASRAESVLNGLNAAVRSTEIVAVHDGARPLVTVDEITRAIERAQQTGAACLVAPVTDTIKEIRGGSIYATLDREKLRRALTPQCFRFELLKRAFEAGPVDSSVTDECYLVEKLGVEIAIVEGSSRNIKITHPEDLAFAEMFLRGPE